MIVVELHYHFDPRFDDVVVVVDDDDEKHPA